MRVAALIFGILGGIIALAIGQLGFALGSLIGFQELKALSFIVPVVALIGAGVVLPVPLLGAALMALSGIIFILILGFNFFTFIPVVLLFIAAGLGLGGLGEARERTTADGTSPQLNPQGVITFFCPRCEKKYEADYSGQFCENCGAQVMRSP
jgi:hypothetical protein